jgi:CubicO group peptidase (beta-lactamase class C family)
VEDRRWRRRTVLKGVAALAAASPVNARTLRMRTAGFTEEGLKALRSTLEAGAQGTAAPGLVALIDRGGQTEVIAAGQRAVGGPPMSRDTLFRIASMTKLVTATAVMVLVEEGKVRLDEPADRLLPELADRRVLKQVDGPLDDTVPAARRITVEDLLTFRHGWGVVFGPPQWPINKAIADLGIVGFGPPNPQMPFDPDEWMRRLATLPLLHQPGEAWMYTNGSDIQGVLVARASGQRFDAFVHDRILRPLGMKDTGFVVPADKLGRLSTAYTSQPGGKLAVFDDPAHSAYATTPQFPEGDSGLISTVDDLLIFSRMLLAGGKHAHGRILSAASVEAMTTNHITPAQATAAQGNFILEGHGWGYGMSVVGEGVHDGLQPGAFGWSGGFGTSWYMDASQGLTTILLTQRLSGSAEPPSLHEAFWAASYKALA